MSQRERLPISAVKSNLAIMRIRLLLLSSALFVLTACGGGAPDGDSSPQDQTSEQEVEEADIESTGFEFVDVDVAPFSGSGDGSEFLDTPIDFPALIEATGPSDMAILTLDENGQESFLEDNFFKEPGLDFRGVYLIGVNSEVHGLRVLTDGDWTLRLKSANDATLIEKGDVLSGNDNDVFRFLDFTTEIIPLNVKAGSGSERFTLSAEGGNPRDLLDGYSQEFDRSDLVLPTETIIVVVESYGSWEIVIG